MLNILDSFNMGVTELMSKELKPPKKPTNEHNPITLDTPEKPKQELEDMDDDKVIALSLL